MLYVDAIRVLEKVARARFDLASMPRKEEIEEAIPIVAGMVTVQACPKYALHAALWWMVIKSKEGEKGEQKNITESGTCSEFDGTLPVNRELHS